MVDFRAMLERQRREAPLKEEFEERAAIKQFDGKMPREEAETQAGLEQLRRLQHERING